MAVDPQIQQLAETAPNFGYLLHHEPLLVMYGAMAERFVFDDSNTSMLKSRQFGEALTAQAFAQFGLSGIPNTQHGRVKALSAHGLLPDTVRDWFDTVRWNGNKANHAHFAAQQAALESLRACYDLGAWFHRTVTRAPEVPPFVPPQPTHQPKPTSADDELAFKTLQRSLERHQTELTEMRLRLDEHHDYRAAEAEAQRSAAEEIKKAVAQQDRMSVLIEALTTKVADLEGQLTAKATDPNPIDATVLEEYLERAKTASRAPLNEAQTRRIIDRMLANAGWVVQDQNEMNVHAGQGVAVREVTTAKGRADYLLYVDAKLVGAIEAKREGTILTTVDQQTEGYAASLTAGQKLAAWRDPLPFRYESTAVETRFTNTLDPKPRPRSVFSFHQPSTIARWMREADQNPNLPTLRNQYRAMPELRSDTLRPAQIEAITGLEKSLAADKPRALIQMATGAGKTFTMVTESYRLLKHANMKRVLFLVDRNNLGEQAESEFRNFRTPDTGAYFSDNYNVQRLQSDVVLGSTNVVISTVQRLYATLRNAPLPDDDIEQDEPDEIADLEYNAKIPPESFDLVIVDECHRSIYGKWRGALEYFDAHMVGLTATPVPQTFAFFHSNLVSQYTFRQAVADGVNVDFDIMRIKTQVGEQGGTIPANTPVKIMDRSTGKVRYEPLDTSLDYNADAIGRSVMNESQIREVIRAYRDGWKEYFENRKHVPKTLIFAKTDVHADAIVRVVREEFAENATFCAKVTYKADKAEQLISDLRNDTGFRIAVTVDMIATGTDVRPLECVMFLRGVSSATYFEQMKGRGARTIDVDEFQRVTPDARAKEKFLIVDAVGVTDSAMVDAKPLQPHSQRQVSLEKLLSKAANQGINAEEAEALASRLAKLNQQVTPAERTELAELADGTTLHDIVNGVERATDADAQEQALQEGGKEAQRQLVLDSVRPLAEHPDLRERILNIRRKYDMPFDEATQDELVSVEAKRMGEDTARHTVDDWRQYMADNADEIDSFRVIFSDPGRDPGELYSKLKQLAAKIATPPYQWTPEKLWQAYQDLGLAKTNGSGRSRSKDIPELMAILRYELGLDAELRPPMAKIEENLVNWLARQEQEDTTFTDHQRWWLDKIAVTIAHRLTVTADDLDGVPFTEHGGTDGFVRAFGDEATAENVLTELNRNLPA